MTLALLADVHANLEALDAVLADVDRRASGAHVVVAGDIVGYGPDPEAVLERLLERRATMVRGNHEEMVLGVRDDRRCIAAGILAVAWTRRRLSRGARAVLAALPPTSEVVSGVVVCHGDLDDAGTYVSDEARARHALARLQERHPHARTLVCGHTHRAMRVADGERALVNPGAVGQTRDGVVSARWALLDPAGGDVAFHQVAYDHRTTLQKLRAAGLIPRVDVTQPRSAWERRAARIQKNAARIIVRVPVLHGAWTAHARRTS